MTRHTYTKTDLKHVRKDISLYDIDKVLAKGLKKGKGYPECDGLYDVTPVEPQRFRPYPVLTNSGIYKILLDLEVEEVVKTPNTFASKKDEIVYSYYISELKVDQIKHVYAPRVFKENIEEHIALGKFTGAFMDRVEWVEIAAASDELCEDGFHTDFCASPERVEYIGRYCELLGGARMVNGLKHTDAHLFSLLYIVDEVSAQAADAMRQLHGEHKESPDQWLSAWEDEGGANGAIAAQIRKFIKK